MKKFSFKHKDTDLGIIHTNATSEENARNILSSIGFNSDDLEIIHCCKECERGDECVSN